MHRTSRWWDGTRDRAHDLRDRVGSDLWREGPSLRAADEPVGERDDRVEVSPGHRSEHEDEHRRPSTVAVLFSELEPDVLRGELCRGNAGPDDHGHQEGGAENSASKRRGGAVSQCRSHENVDSTPVAQSNLSQ